MSTLLASRPRPISVSVIISCLFALSLVLGAPGYATLAIRVIETVTGRNTIEAPELAEAAGDNAEIFVKTDARSQGEVMFETASLVDKIYHLENAIAGYFTESRATGFFITLNGGFQSAIGNRLALDSVLGEDVIKLPNGYLARLQNPKPGVYESNLKQIGELNSFLIEKQIPLIYTHAPYKVEYSDIPLPNKYKIAIEDLNKGLVQAGVKVVDVKSEMDRDGRDFFSYYFKTDHHWTGESGLWYAGMITEKLSADYGFKYDRALLDPANYTYEVLSDWFLGSQGKRVGPLFTGVDDFTIIHPSFETSLASDTLYDSGEWEHKSGTLEEALYWSERVKKKDYFSGTPYAMYAGGDNPIQLIRNNNAPNSMRVMLIKHSYADVAIPFLSLAFSDLCVLDLRHTGRPDNLYDYIDEYGPDLVLFLW
ncbi:MAG: hypothetical protein LBT59_10640 [Clostridiales bacterium]|jgi:hypothetical protein|nr:hypothetical protein [Clostridiales bacterium]